MARQSELDEGSVRLTPDNRPDDRPAADLDDVQIACDQDAIDRERRPGRNNPPAEPSAATNDGPLPGGDPDLDDDDIDVCGTDPDILDEDPEPEVLVPPTPEAAEISPEEIQRQSLELRRTLTELARGWAEEDFRNGEPSEETLQARQEELECALSGYPHGLAPDGHIDREYRAHLGTLTERREALLREYGELAERHAREDARRSGPITERELENRQLELEALRARQAGLVATPGADEARQAYTASYNRAFETSVADAARVREDERSRNLSESTETALERIRELARAQGGGLAADEGADHDRIFEEIREVLQRMAEQNPGMSGEELEAAAEALARSYQEALEEARPQPEGDIEDGEIEDPERSEENGEIQPEPIPEPREARNPPPFPDAHLLASQVSAVVELTPAATTQTYRADLARLSFESGAEAGSSRVGPGRQMIERIAASVGAAEGSEALRAFLLEHADGLSERGVNLREWARDPANAERFERITASLLAMLEARGESLEQWLENEANRALLEKMLDPQHPLGRQLMELAGDLENPDALKSAVELLDQASKHESPEIRALVENPANARLLAELIGPNSKLPPGWLDNQANREQLLATLSVTLQALKDSGVNLDEWLRNDANREMLLQMMDPNGRFMQNAASILSQPGGRQLLLDTLTVTITALAGSGDKGAWLSDSNNQLLLREALDPITSTVQRNQSQLSDPQKRADLLDSLRATLTAVREARGDLAGDLRSPGGEQAFRLSVGALLAYHGETFGQDRAAWMRNPQSLAAMREMLRISVQSAREEGGFGKLSDPRFEAGFRETVCNFWRAVGPSVQAGDSRPTTDEGRQELSMLLRGAWAGQQVALERGAEFGGSSAQLHAMQSVWGARHTGCRFENWMRDPDKWQDMGSQITWHLGCLAYGVEEMRRRARIWSNQQSEDNRRHSTSEDGKLTQAGTENRLEKLRARSQAESDDAREQRLLEVKRWLAYVRDMAELAEYSRQKSGKELIKGMTNLDDFAELLTDAMEYAEKHRAEELKRATQSGNIQEFATYSEQGLKDLLAESGSAVLAEMEELRRSLDKQQGTPQSRRS